MKKILLIWTFFALAVFANGQIIPGVVASQYQATDPYGIERLVNGTFTDNIDPWTGTNWAYDSGHALHTAGNTTALTQTGLTTTGGLTYHLSIDIGGRTAGGISVTIGGTEILVYTDSNGTHTANGVDGAGTQRIQILVSSTFDGWIDNVSLKEVL